MENTKRYQRLLEKQVVSGKEINPLLGFEEFESDDRWFGTNELCLELGLPVVDYDEEFWFGFPDEFEIWRK